MFIRLILPLYRSEVSDVKPLISASVLSVLRGAAFAAVFDVVFVLVVAGLVEASGFSAVDEFVFFVDSVCAVSVAGALSGC